MLIHINKITTFFKLFVLIFFTLFILIKTIINNYYFIKTNLAFDF